MGNNGNNDRLFSWAPKSLQMGTAAMELKDACSLEGQVRPTWMAGDLQPRGLCCSCTWTWEKWKTWWRLKGQCLLLPNVGGEPARQQQRTGQESERLLLSLMGPQHPTAASHADSSVAMPMWTTRQRETWGHSSNLGKMPVLFFFKWNKEEYF